MMVHNTQTRGVRRDGDTQQVLTQMKYEFVCYPEGCAAPGSVPCQCNTRRILSKLENTLPQRKINVTSKSPVEDISVVTLIRTDTTLDHSQKAEKVCKLRGMSNSEQTIIIPGSFVDLHYARTGNEVCRRCRNGMRRA
jgi:hypothetical protein